MENFFVLNMDPGAVFSGSPVSMLNWAEHSFGRVPLPDRRTAVMQVVQQRRLQPRRVSLDVLSSFCLSDLSREWVSLVLDCVVAEKSPEEATWKSTSEKFVLKNPKRYLVDNRLLRHYAEYMKFGFLSPADECFSAFLDECGECKRAEEMPSAIEFTMDSGRRHASDTLRTVLRSLAPASAYWCAVVDEFPQNIACSVAPMGEVRVVVQLPTINRTADTTTTYRAVTEKPLHEDDAIAVLEKPAGLPTTSHALSPPTSVDLVDVLLHSTKGDIFSSVFRSGVVHRLDADTSGVIVVAKTNHASDGLRHQFGTSGAHSLCSKTYYAVCVVLESLKDIPLKGVLKDPSDPKIRTKFRIVKFEKKSRTALVECRIFQGKKHQIRRHLATLGMPILGDVDHGGAVCVTPLFERVALHASSVTFNHPTTGVSTCVKSPIPSSFLEVFTKST
ncbi:23S rRNA pseudouridine1911/1915/1917 synthase [Angomonas deanei]|uniref:RNA pseudouridylate synthase, putative n=1 Tax=Angomonas deanei TaxID=59799 RepID=A0A7G2CBW1_9TRYP|nr:23S rRNA pseudouridine1911/1915/1917 synthase [Angomonas deanei]CAD2216511.1 RNA pseudouridylate synthase, putative [Angomonas deanei]|eukprot:EPY34087.1 23S rRNA pseudouridine1911/1915/1917 synthase [Angomonas deanei]